ncbi:response regulator transcription factor [bacterium]|nr:MAG: response regulator transcription factor [bacterium]
MAIAENLVLAGNEVRGMKLLIIDDEPAITETLEAKFRREGFTTFAADSAEEGMRLFRRIKPDLVILDIMLPGRSGCDFLRSVRKEHSTPVIFVSAPEA